jgi:hypothetical protein
VFLLGEFTVLTELFHQVGLFRLTLGWIPLGLLLLLAFSRRLGIRIGVGVARILTLTSVIVRVRRHSGGLVGFGLGHRGHASLTSNLASAFPVTLVNLLNEVMKLIHGSGLIEMNQLILDSFQHGSICLPIERQVVVVEHSQDSVKVDEELCRLVTTVVFHHQFLSSISASACWS